MRFPLRTTFASANTCPLLTGVKGAERAFEDGAGVAYGIGGLNYYDELCFDTTIAGKCHHAVSQMVPGHIPAHVFHGTAFYQQSLVAHEIGHNNTPDLRGSPVCWLLTGSRTGRTSATN